MVGNAVFTVSFNIRFLDTHGSVAALEWSVSRALSAILLILVRSVLTVHSGTVAANVHYRVKSGQNAQ